MGIAKMTQRILQQRILRLDLAAVLLIAISPLVPPVAAQNSASAAQSKVGAANSSSSSGQTPSASRKLPFWAYPVFPPGVVAPPASPDDGARKHLPGSVAAFTTREIADRFNVADWFPNTHPPMPDVVAHGRKAAAVQGCGYCHLPNGQGHPQNASLAGLPAAYFAEQIGDFKSGLRKSSETQV